MNSEHKKTDIPLFKVQIWVIITLTFFSDINKCREQVSMLFNVDVHGLNQGKA